MSQHDYNIANGGGAAVRSDINNALLAILSQNSGATAPTTTKPFMTWYDTANGIIKIRNSADTAWLDYMNSSGQLIAPTATGLITALGGQIKFPATQNASSDANTLDDYEEGTFTPVMAPGSGSITSQTCYGKYTKIGNTVTVVISAAIGTVGSASGNMTISGLPFLPVWAGSGRPSVSFVREDSSTGYGYMAITGNGQSFFTLFTLSTNVQPPWASGYQYTFNATYITS
jgi:hypothetical protein